MIGLLFVQPIPPDAPDYRRRKRDRRASFRRQVGTAIFIVLVAILYAYQAAVDGDLLPLIGVPLQKGDL